MKKLSGKESRFVRNTSHVISSEIVHEAKGNSSTTAMENLEGIRMGTTVMKGKMYIHNSWSFPHFRSFIEYKEREADIPVIVVDPHNTSRECPNCHAITRRTGLNDPGLDAFPVALMEKRISSLPSTSGTGLLSNSLL